MSKCLNQRFTVWKRQNASSSISLRFGDSSMSLLLGDSSMSFQFGDDSSSNLFACSINIWKCHSSANTDTKVERKSLGVWCKIHQIKTINKCLVNIHCTLTVFIMFILVRASMVWPDMAKLASLCLCTCSISKRVYLILMWDDLSVLGRDGNCTALDSCNKHFVGTSKSSTSWTKSSGKHIGWWAENDRTRVLVCHHGDQTILFHKPHDCLPPPGNHSTHLFWKKTNNM